MAYLWVALGGALGAMGRFAVSGVFLGRFGSGVLGTVFANISGAFLIGFIMALTEERVVVSPDIRRFLTVGILGGYTTFSTWMYETHLLAGRGDVERAVLNVAGSLLLGLVAVWLGVAAGRAV
ncbi:MAG TPA: fluoride efflux transporter CrcB [Thermomicrobiales bacterium]|nr:fluoride efflux transporter CrcB [Thermomicrobiales bacterium]